jgi:pantothenate synthetase
MPGHVSLFETRALRERRRRRQACSVNRSQFTPREDFAQYPRDEER